MYTLKFCKNRKPPHKQKICCKSCGYLLGAATHDLMENTANPSLERELEMDQEERERAAVAPLINELRRRYDAAQSRIALRDRERDAFLSMTEATLSRIEQMEREIEGLKRRDMIVSIFFWLFVTWNFPKFALTVIALLIAFAAIRWTRRP